MSDPIDPNLVARMREVMERAIRIAPELVRYAWRGEGLHEPFPEHAVLGLKRVQVTWLKTNSETPEPGWLTDAEQLKALVSGQDIPEDVKRALTSDARPYTTVKVRYWSEGLDEARYVLYKLSVGGAGSEDGTSTS